MGFAKKFMSKWTLVCFVVLVVMSRIGCFKSPSDIRYVGRVAYDGTSFRGFQAQPFGIPTVQTTILDVLRLKLGPQTVLAGASRTDVGVHARGNCFHFDVPLEKHCVVADIVKFEHQINRMLPDSVRVFDIQVAPEGSALDISQSKPFHATSSSIGKKYSYSFCTARNGHVDPLRRRYCAHYRNDIDQGLLQLCLAQFIGTHDFASFANNIPKSKLLYESVGTTLETTRTVQSIEVQEVEKGYYQINFCLKSALYQMIRNMVGTSILVAEGKMPLSQVQELLKLAPGRECNPAKSAPPEGLVLEHVYYDNY